MAYWWPRDSRGRRRPSRAIRHHGRGVQRFRRLRRSHLSVLPHKVRAQFSGELNEVPVEIRPEAGDTVVSATRFAVLGRIGGWDAPRRHALPSVRVLNLATHRAFN